MVLLEVSSSALVSLFVIAVAAAIAPLLTSLVRGRVPDVVWLLALGVLIGPSALGWATAGEGVDMVRQIGLGLLFLLAGYEMEPRPLARRAGRSAAWLWLLCLAVGFGLVYLVVPGAEWKVAAALAICLCSTALGTLLPIIKTTGESDSPLGRAVLLHGAMGELGPVIAMSLLLSSKGALHSSLVLLAFAAATVAAAAVPRRIVEKLPWVGRAIDAGANTTAQTTLRFIFALLTGLMALSAVFELDVVLGAFAAGVVVRALTPDDEHLLERKLEVLAFSFLVPVFFVTSGMAIQVDAVAARPWLLVGFVAMIVVARGLPVFLGEKLFDTGSGLASDRDRVRLGLYSATGLPIIVAVTELATSQGLMPSDIASVLVASGAATVLLFPLLASLIGGRGAAGEAERVREET